MMMTTGWTTNPPDAVYIAQVCQGQRWYVDRQWDAPNADDSVLYVGDDDDNDHLPNPWRTRRFMDDELFTGAFWLERKVPVDPFARPAATGPKYLIFDARQIVGNCAMFRRPDGAGYTCDLNEAGLYDGSVEHRDTEIYVPIEAARLMAVTHVRVEPLKRAGYWPKPPVIKREPQRCEGCPRFVKRGGWLCRDCLNRIEECGAESRTARSPQHGRKGSGSL